MSLAFNGVNNFHFTLGLVELDHGPVAAQLVRALDAPQLKTGHDRADGRHTGTGLLRR